ncbi:MAG TPA: ankyrin repeat domain-containing protein [Cyclobacteriaceae bacterium]|nr:ankyrin repeat domain-containing protein [Cyclobacteriaceae bacterium]
MKNQKLSTRSLSCVLALSVIILASCGSDAQTKKNGKEAPTIDIHTAVITNNMEVLKQHLEAGTNINEKDPFGGSSPLISAALFDKPEMVKTLLGAGADINFQNNDGSTALHTAAFFCRPEIVKMLVEKKADKTIKNKYGATAYDNVAGPYADLKSTYEMLEKMLAPMGLKLDYPYIEKTRPEIAKMLK